MKKIWFFFLVLIAPYWIFAEISWGTPAQVSASSIDASVPVVVQDTDGNTTAVWIEGTSLVSKSLPAGGAWSSATTLTTVAPSSLQLAVDGDGNVIALWVENNKVYSANLPFSGSWGSKTAISDTGASQARLSVNSNGDAVAVWSRNLFIEATVQPSGGSWSLVSMLSSNGTDDYPDVALGNDGSMVAVWHTIDGNGADTIHYSNGNSLGSWNVEGSVLSQSPALHHHYPRVAIDGNGDATAVWFRYTHVGNSYSTVQLMTASLTSASNTWSNIPTPLSGTGLRNPILLQSQVHYDDSGNVIALWTNSYDGKTFNVESAVMPLGKGWIPGGALALQNLYSYQGDLAVDPQGHAIAVYMYYDSADLIIQSAETDLTNPQPNFYSIPVTISSGTDNGYPRVAFSTQGSTLNAVALWQGFDGMNTTIQAVTGSRTVILPPTSLSVVQTSNGFGIFTEYVNTISWTLSASPNVSQYIIFRNGFEIGGVDGNTTQFAVDNAVQNGAVSYGVLAIDDTNAQSAIAIINYP
jgi:hypothetical protein